MALIVLTFALGADDQISAGEALESCGERILGQRLNAPLAKRLLLIVWILRGHSSGLQIFQLLEFLLLRLFEHIQFDLVILL